MEDLKSLNLQLFAEGDAGGEGAGDGTTVENTADDGRARLLELGVPEDKIRKKRAKTETRIPTAEQKTPPQPEAQQQDAAAQEEAPKEEKADTRLKWDDIVKDPEYNREIQKIVQERLKTAKGAQENLDKLSPALGLLAAKYGLDGDNLDYAALGKAISEDDEYYEDKAISLGVDVSTAKKLDLAEKEAERKTQEAERTIRDIRMRAHFEGLQRQGEELKKTFPGFNLQTELQNPAFRRMTAPEINLPVADAYFACHREDLQKAAMQVSAQKTAEKLSASIQAGASRPVENGTSGQAPTVATFDYRKASPEQRDALKRKIREAAARGEKIYPTGK